MPREPVGGGLKKVLYTLRTAQRIGLARTGKALKSNNTCKACAYGMGGQAGGMTNELGEFPSVCNKSVQAQSTDIQPAIPEAVFGHPITELAELSPHELEHLGRLATPLHRASGGDHYRPVDWDTALEIAATRLRATDPARAFFLLIRPLVQRGGLSCSNCWREPGAPTTSTTAATTVIRRPVWRWVPRLARAPQPWSLPTSTVLTPFL